MNLRQLRHVLAAAGLALVAASPAFADNVVVSTSIQAAVDAANPGDTIVVPPGRYHSPSGSKRAGSRSVEAAAPCSTRPVSPSGSAWRPTRAGRAARRRR
jgi:hypothetical protein